MVNLAEAHTADVQWFENIEEERLSKRTTLDEHDRHILILKLTRPGISNTEVGRIVGLNRIQVWRRLTKGPLARVWVELQREALSSAQDLVIASALDAVQALRGIANGTCDCPEIVVKLDNSTGEGEGGHRMKCLTPVPYAVRRAAAVNLLEILRSKGIIGEEGDGPEEEVWEAAVNAVGGVTVKKSIDVKQIPGSKDGETE